uniref:SCP domain-containing protein n=1 Tax=Callorhinchus milii TaxID=7868 RepID=A0A4W3GHL4_CALMI
SWSYELENISKEYVAKCAYESNPNKKENIGENLFTTFNRFRPKAAVDYWHVEGDNFNLNKMKCSSGKDCRRYMQVVCAATESIGCASLLCDTIKGTSLVKSTLLVCYYSPG